MKATSFLFAFLFFVSAAQAQFGISGRYYANNAQDWTFLNDSDINAQEVLGNGYSVGIDYWFRLKNYRVEFLPELNVASFENNAFNGVETTLNTYSFFLNTNFYLFDFAGDCNCPTFSKQGEFAKKGFFVQVSPGVSYFQLNVSPEEKIEESPTALAANIGAGLGFDFGISDLLTFTPMVGARYYPKVNLEGLGASYIGLGGSIKSDESALLQLFAGARLGFRFDYQSNRRRR